MFSVLNSTDLRPEIEVNPCGWTTESQKLIEPRSPASCKASAVSMLREIA